VVAARQAALNNSRSWVLRPSSIFAMTMNEPGPKKEAESMGFRYFNILLQVSIVHRMKRWMNF
jgi:hypothetical protein